MTKKTKRQDASLSVFLDFLAAEITRRPGDVTALDQALIERIGKLVDGVETLPDEDLGDEVLI